MNLRRTGNLTLFEKVLAGIFAIIIVLMVMGVYVGGSAGFAFVVELLWNYVVDSMHHHELHVNFFVAWAATILLGLIFRPIRIAHSKKDE